MIEKYTINSNKILKIVQLSEYDLFSILGYPHITYHIRQMSDIISIVQYRNKNLISLLHYLDEFFTLLKHKSMYQQSNLIHNELLNKFKNFQYHNEFEFHINPNLITFHKTKESLKTVFILVLKLINIPKEHHIYVLYIMDNILKIAEKNGTNLMELYFMKSFKNGFLKIFND